jgi:hypothetical protein
MESNIYFCTPCIIMSSIVATLCMGFIYCALRFLSNESGTLVTFLFDFFMCVQQESVEATAEVSKTFDEKIRKYCYMTLLSCAYAGTGNVLKVIYLIHLMLLIY